MISSSPTINYFGMATVEQAIASYFAKNGLSEDVRDRLTTMVSESEDDFFQMVCDFIEKKS